MSGHPAFEARRALSALLEQERANPRLRFNPEWNALVTLARLQVKQAVQDGAGG